MERWYLNEAGFVENYMIAGPRILPYETSLSDVNQLQFEKKVRREVVTDKPKYIEPEICVGKPSLHGEPWSVYYSYGNWFIDVSNFYSILQKVELEAATVLEVERDMEVKAILWTYMSVGVYCNGVFVGEQKNPVYKPIQSVEIILPLKKGKNLIYFLCETMGVRDTRNILGLQVLERQDEIAVRLADESYEESVYQAEKFLSELYLKSNCILFPGTAPEGTAFCYGIDSPDYKDVIKPVDWKEVSGCTQIELKEPKKMVSVRVKVGELEFCRNLERNEECRPMYGKKGISVDENKKIILQRIANVYSLSRGKKYGFGISNVLARKFLGQGIELEEELLYDTLRLIDIRVDCSDFLLCGLVRYLHHYDMSDALKVRTKEVLLRYRYWMDMKGTDAMCFWSENHALMFYACAMQVGDLYKEEYFERADMTGKELYEYGRKKVVQWLDDVEEHGFEEFLSTVYMCVTFAALLNVIDFSEVEISERATKITDELLEMLALHTFKGVVIAPMGRVYREILYPFYQGAQAMMNLVNPEVPYAYGEGWLGFLPTSKYQIPRGLKEKMREEAEADYTTGNARIILHKKKDYCLTSVLSPREESFQRWPNIEKDSSLDQGTHEYTKSLNECFHGTTCFEPGVYGYQQHMWYAALDAETVIFTNHPGATCENSGMRPGYWNGNGIMPAMRQSGESIGMIYVIPKEHPIHFTHVYCPKNRFHQVKEEGQWIFLQKENGMLALWSSDKMQDYNDVIFGCEKRVYGDEVAYLCICGSMDEYGSFDKFIETVRERSPEFHKESKTLMVKGEEFLQYKKCSDQTQYID